MELSISNIAWSVENNDKVYSLMKRYGYTGLEIAPTKIFPVNPYDKLVEASVWSEKLKEIYDLSISSMQSIWFGRHEKLFYSEVDRKQLLNYTKKAIDFAAVIKCKNLVFGCPKNRSLPENASSKVAVSFFKEVGDYAASKGTVIGMEANPSIYNTNYINDTTSALDLIKSVGSEGFKLNLDIGAMIENEESLATIEGHVNHINHVHISEPMLRPIENRKIHKELKKALSEGGYTKFVSIEMGAVRDLSIIEKVMHYVRSIFDE